MKIAIFAVNPAFLSYVRTEFSQHHMVREYEHTNSETFNLAQIQRLVDWADLIFFDFGQFPLNVVSNLPCVDKPVVVRGHGIELFSPDEVNWNNVSLLIVTPICKQIFLDQEPKTMPKKIIELPVGHDTSLFTFSPLKEKRKFGKKILTHSTVMRPKKRIYTTVQMFREILDEDSSWELHIVGEWKSGFRETTVESQEQYNWPIKRLLETLSLEDKVWFTPQMPQKTWAEYLWDKDIFWSNSILEGYHVSLGEAVSSGLYPVINCWWGASNFFRENFIHKTMSSMKKAILDWGRLDMEEKYRLAKASSQDMRKFDVREVARSIREACENVKR